jgi:hypothetical protein
MEIELNMYSTLDMMAINNALLEQYPGTLRETFPPTSLPIFQP